MIKLLDERLFFGGEGEIHPPNFLNMIEIATKTLSYNNL